VSARPYLRFALVGAVLFAFDLAAPRAAAPPAGLDDDALLVHAALARGLHETDDVVRRRLAQNLRFLRPDDARDDDALVREALALGMHESDLVVRRRLAQKMRLLLAEPARAAEPTEAELAAWLAAHPERFTEPARVTLAQLYFRDAPRAEAALARLRAGAAPDGLGDPLPLPRELPSHAAAELAARLGPVFADAVFAAEDEGWFGPVASSYGAHLVCIRGRQAARLSALATVRGEVREALLAERAEAAVRAGIAALRQP
jgi:parvulin-like peptidyl-prolyl isomerase